MLLPSRRDIGAWTFLSALLDKGQATRALRSSLSFSASLLLQLLVPGLATPCLSAEPNPDESKLIAVLQSTSSSAREKDAACAALKRFGTAHSVSALAGLLTDPELSHSARYVLESLPHQEAGEVLIAALPKTSGPIQAGIIHSLQVRRERAAVPALAGIVTGADEAAACAAAEALGEIGSDAAEVVERGLNQVRRNQRVRLALADARLKIAQSLLDAGAPAEALASYQRLTESSWPEHIRTAAWRGVFLTSGKRGLNQMVGALQGEDLAARTASLSLVPIISVAGSAEVLAQALLGLPLNVQVAVIEGLAQRGDASAASSLVRALRNGTPESRTAAVIALGVLGDASHAGLLAEKAASARGTEQAAARQALAQLNRGPVSEEITRLLGSAAPSVQSELARALGERHETTAAPALIELARSENGTSAAAAFQALGAISGSEHLAALVDLVLKASNPEGRSRAVEALNSTVQRLLISQGRVDPEPLIRGLRSDSAQGRAALLPVCSAIIAEPVREALRRAVQSSDETVRAAGVSAMCDTVDPSLLPDLIELASNGPDVSSRSRATAGVVRLWSQEEPARVPHAEKIRSAEALSRNRLSEDQWRKLLAGLAEIGEPAVLPLVQAQLANPALRNEAARAVVRLCGSLPQTETARRSLSALDLSSLDEGTRTAAVDALKQLEARLAFLTSWQVAGPFRQTGKGFSELFDLPFGPEKEPSQVQWQPAQLSTDPAKPYGVDLLRSFGGEQCVGYARTEVQAEAEADGLLEIGSDDGIKIWLNGALVHANNTARPLQPGQDKARVHLKPGRNEVLLKLTQNNAGWEFCIKLVSEDGRLIKGVTSR